MEYTNNGTLNGTKVPTPSEETNKMKNNMKGGGVLTPSKHDIHNGTEVPAPKGYKRTKVGVIPEEWEVVKLGDLGKVSMCKRVLKKETSPNGDVPFFKIGTFGNKADAFISKKLYEEYKEKYPFPKVGDILISAAGTIGRTVVYDGKPAYFQDSNIVWIDNNQEIVRNDFLYYCYKNIKWRTEDTTIPRLYNDNLRDMTVPCPPIPEQQKIAEILSTWDRAIEKLETLIEAKERLKKGLMQKLLSAELRFPGFSGEWEEVRLGDVLKIGSGKDYKHLKSGSIPVYGTGGYMLSVDSFLYDGESVCIGRKGTIDKPQFISGKFWTVDTLFYTHSYKNIIPKFAYFCFLRINWLKYNEASGVPSLSKTTIDKIKIKLPSLQEQQKITDMLSLADKEIELLKKELAALQEQKRGLMQKLLTGEVRVRI
jgi:type I restriction enzyme S subunit